MNEQVIMTFNWASWVMTPLLNDFPKLCACSQTFISCVFRKSKKNDDVFGSGKPSQTKET